MTALAPSNAAGTKPDELDCLKEAAPADKPMPESPKPLLATGPTVPAPRPPTGPDLAAQLAKEVKSPVPMTAQGLWPTDLEGVYRIAQFHAISGMVPDSISKGARDLKELTARCFIILSAGYARGLNDSQSMAGIVVVRNVPSVWGNTMVALMQRSPHYMGHDSTTSGEGKTLVATYWVSRRVNGEKQTTTRTFGWADAEAAGLHGKDTYKSWTKDMYVRRAGSRAIQAGFADALLGLASADELLDGEASAEARKQADAQSNIDALDRATGKT